MKSVILAAGRGRRMGSAGEQVPKILLRFAGRSLLERHLAILEGCGVKDVFLVAGYRSDLVREEVARIGSRCRVGLIENPRFTEGSVVSLHAAEPVLKQGAPILLMDGDVLYDRRLLDRLVRSPFASCLLIDRNFEPGDEPVKVCIAGGRIVDFHKAPKNAHDWFGESVGFFRLSAPVAAELAARAENYVSSGRVHMEYEEPMRDLILSSRPGTFGYEDVTGLPWTEIDFPEDVVRAEAEILPALHDSADHGAAR